MIKLKNVRVIAEENGAPSNQTHLVAMFEVTHKAPDTDVFQDLVLTKSACGWKAEMEMDNFPYQETAEDAALTLARWFKRLAAELEHSSKLFGPINLDSMARGGKLIG